MKTLQAVTALQLASLSLAKPLLGLEHLKSLVARENPEGMTWEDMCNQWKLDDDDASIAQQLWYNTGTGAWFDEWLLAHEDRKFWTATMDGEVNK
jgi:hypothetical protein